EGSKLLAEILPDWIKSKIKSKPQIDTEATFTKKVEKADGLIVFSNKLQIDADSTQTNTEKENSYKNYLKILAYEDWPKTYFIVKKADKEMRVVIKKASWKNDKLEIERVIPEGKKEMNYADFLRGISI
ncbi:hypothetical protein MEO93_29420, partial [Dolichospermum sp. ST_sed3]|nr:hypothetical protein [Dolichospermum sp. ST_sed3]